MVRLPYGIRPAARAATAAASLLTLLIGAACAESGSVELRGDIGGLDTVAQRGDSLLEQSRRPAVLTDSGMLVLPGSPAAAPPAVTASPEVPAAPPSAYAVAESITRRALARSESLASAPNATTAAGDESTRRAAADTARGILRATVRDGVRETVLEAGARRYLLSGVATRDLLALNGMEVLVRGVAVTPRDLVASQVIVRGWESLPALDGVVLADGALRLTDGTGVARRPLPPAVRAWIGARVWVAYRDGRPVQFDRVER